MKRFKVICFFSLLFILISCGASDDRQLPSDIVQNPASANGSNDKSGLPVIEFENYEHDFGQLIQGERVSYAFRFTNTGKSDLVIASANAGCGCTVPNFPRHPIKPGEKGTIEVAFNSTGRSGVQNQRVSIVANTQPNTTVLTVRANIVVP